MSSLNDHTARWQHHPQPARVPATHWSKTGELHGGVEPGECGECACPNDHGPDGVIACWSPGGPCAVPNDPACETCGPCFNCTDRHPLTPADPHQHAWADLGTPGLHGSVCRLCGETQID